MLKQFLVSLIVIAIIGVFGSVAAANIQIEAEDMAMKGYQIDTLTKPWFSGKIVARSPIAGNIGTLTAIFEGATGAYDVTIAHIDVSGGVGSLELLIDGISVEKWDLNINAASINDEASYVVRVISKINLTSGSELMLKGKAAPSGVPVEYARVDYINLASGTNDILWHEEDPFTISWSAVITLEDGKPLPEGDYISYQVWLKNYDTNEEIAPVETLNTSCSFVYTDVDPAIPAGRYIGAVKALRYNANGLFIAESTVSWSSNANVTANNQAFGNNFVIPEDTRAPANARGMKVVK